MNNKRVNETLFVPANDEEEAMRRQLDATVAQEEEEGQAATGAPNKQCGKDDATTSTRR